MRQHRRHLRDFHGAVRREPLLWGAAPAAGAHQRGHSLGGGANLRGRWPLGPPLAEHVAGGGPWPDTLEEGSLCRAVSALRGWLNARADIAAALTGQPQLARPELIQQFAPTGILFGWHLRGAHECPPAWNQRGFHGTALHTLGAVFRNGLAAGWKGYVRGLRYTVRAGRPGVATAGPRQTVWAVRPGVACTL